MPIIDIQQLSKLYYSIGEVSKLLDVNPSLLRFWEKEFQLEVSKKNKKGNRLFTVKEIEKINKIYHFVKVEGYTLEGAKKALKLKEEKQEKTVEYDSNKDLIRRLEAIRVKLLSLKKS
jgi:DNA-binding transcriptional MerR regulator